MAKYLIEQRHTGEGCLEVLDAFVAHRPGDLSQYDWGCAGGEHAGYAIVEVGSRSAVEASIPPAVRSRTRIVELSTFTPAQIAAYHRGL